MTDTSLYFATPIYRSKVKSDLENYVIDMSENEKSVRMSNTGGWQSRHYTRPEKEFELLWAQIEEKINEFHKSLSLKHHLEISDLWFNVNYKGSANRQHQHSGSIHSGVYYIRTPENCGNICFMHPSQSITWSWPNNLLVNEQNYINSSMVSIKPIKNMLLIFPSWSEHSVDTNESDDTRISLSFNTKLIGV